MRRRAMIAALVALLGVGLLAVLFGVAGDGEAPEADLAVAGVTCEGVPATIVGTDQADVLEGTPGPDVIAAKTGADIIRSYRGDDIVCGGPGDDRITTGAGGDVAIGGGGDDWVNSAAGPDRVVGGAGDETVALRTTPGAPVTLLGDEGLDLLTLTVGGTLPVLVDQADEVLILGPEPDHEPGEFGGWEVVWLKGDHPWTYVGTASRDSVIATEGSLTASTYGGNDVVSAGAGDDIVNGGEGRRDAAGVVKGRNSCAQVEWGDCGPPIVAQGLREVGQRSSAARAASTGA